MLQLQEIRKKYVTGALVQDALDGVSFALRDNEFVAVLGPSGSGKTTLLNVIGGLDRYDSGDLIIGGVSTKRYKDRDWDSYRNHTIGFVFQSYNLIPHQSVLSNVELALTISGVSRAERKRRAAEALEKVGLGDQLHKRPNQLSGGQMQRVAIARALVNDPDILLADEPTGALDSTTSVQVMELLREVARDRLVVMVTHNAELAAQYATRTIKLRDGRVTEDSDPYTPQTAAAPVHRNLGRATMSFWTALALSFNNLRTKKGRTVLTAFAGSIGIIGIALILALSAGVNLYIEDIQKETMTAYPIAIDATSIDLTSVLAAGQDSATGTVDHALDGVYSNSLGIEMASSFTSSIAENNLSAFKHWLDDPDAVIRQYLGEEGVVYSYDTRFDVYARDPDGVLVDTDGVDIGSAAPSASSMMAGMGGMSAMMPETGNFRELLPGRDGSLVSAAEADSYDLLYGHWPEARDEVVLLLDRNNEIPLTVLYELGLLPAADYDAMMESLRTGEDVASVDVRWSYADACAQTFYLIPACDRYADNGNGTFAYVADDAEALEALLGDAVELKVVGVMRSTEAGTGMNAIGSVGYTSILTDWLVAHTDDSAVVRAQKASPDVSVLNGLLFSPADDETKAADAKLYLASLNVSEKAAICRDMLAAMYADPSANANVGPSEYANVDPSEYADVDPSEYADVDPSEYAGVDPSEYANANPSAGEMNEQQLADALDRYLEAPETETLVAIYDAYISTGTYDENLTAFGVVSLDAPSRISIYSDTFEDKDGISSAIEEYNAGAAEADQITYTDYIGLLLSSVTMIVNVISYVLIAFVSVSLIVSSIMIGIITHISVLERTKEIGILRAIGASKRNVSQVFNAETFIVGLFAGTLGVTLSALLTVPINAVVHALTGNADVNAVLSPAAAGILVVLSVLLTLVAGLLPSRAAAGKDPVAALRTE